MVQYTRAHTQVQICFRKVSQQDLSRLSYYKMCRNRTCSACKGSDLLATEPAGISKILCHIIAENTVLLLASDKMDLLFRVTHAFSMGFS